ncbi:MAG: tetratricopeptide repeat protein [Clostridia bacterium]|nr:tetratricopeptide repeat protein [Clostridia bacterium]
MQAAQILERADALFAAGLGAEAAALLEQNYEQAGQEGDWQTRLTLVNELMGYYRSISRLDRAWVYVDEARQLLEEHGLARTLAGVTTVLNIATVFRADRKPNEALALYREVEQVYLAEGLTGDCRLGGLYNNMAVASLEAGEMQQALDYARAAVSALAGAEDAAGERATVYANLAAALMQADPPAFDEAETCLTQALSLFREEDPMNPHYGGALSARAYLAFRRGEEDRAIELYRQAMEVTRRAFGENRDWQRLAANLEVLLKRKEQRG